MSLAPVLMLLVARQASPTEAINKFVAAFNAKDFKAIARLCVGGNEKAAAQFPTTGMPTISVSDVSETITGETAVVKLTIHFQENGSDHVMGESDNFKKVGDRWLILPADPKTLNPGGLSMIAAAMANPSTLAQGKEAAEKVACLSNLKQLGLGMLMYMNDFDDKFPAAGSDVKKLIYPYTKNESIWNCPATKAPAYSFNARLFGKTGSAVAFPAQTVMFYEGKNYKLDFRHDGKAGVSFVDGHAKMVDKADAAKLHWRPN